jgi:hypothetical protein
VQKCGKGRDGAGRLVVIKMIPPGGKLVCLGASENDVYFPVLSLLACIVILWMDFDKWRRSSRTLLSKTPSEASRTFYCGGRLAAMKGQCSS